MAKRLTLDDVRRINSMGTAVPDAEYEDVSGIFYIGTSQGRLRRIISPLVGDVTGKENKTVVSKVGNYTTEELNVILAAAVKSERESEHEENELINDLEAFAVAMAVSL